MCTMTTTAISQTVTMQELLDKSKCKEYSCFNDFIATKGFSYFKSDEESRGKWYLYLSDEKFPTSSNSDVSISNSSIITFNTDGSTTSGFRTAIIERYTSMLSQLKSLGFIAISTTDIDNGVIVSYQSKSQPNVTVSVQTDKIGDSAKWTSYDISVVRSFN